MIKALRSLEQSSLTLSRKDHVVDLRHGPGVRSLILAGTLSRRKLWAELASESRKTKSFGNLWKGSFNGPFY